MTSGWVQEQVEAFGRLLELSSFALDDRGLAAVRFENGVKLRLEAARSDLWVQTLFPFPSDAASSARLLAEAHPSANRGTAHGVRAAYLERTGEALLAVKLERDRIEASAIDVAFRDLFERAVRLGRSA